MSYSQGDSHKVPERKPGWYPDPQGTDGERWWDGQQWTEMVNPSEAELKRLYEQAVTTPPSQDGISAIDISDDLLSKTSEFPAVNNWRTSVVFSILGFITGLFFRMILVFVLLIIFSVVFGASSQFVLYYTGILPYTVGILSSLMPIVYSQLIYPTYFRKKPLLKSYRAISFCNFAFCDIVFGSLFNTNLTISKRTGMLKKGSSYNVLALLSAIMLVFYIYNIINIELPKVQYAQKYYEQLESTTSASARSSSTSSASSSESRVAVKPGNTASGFRDETAGISFAIPSGWTKYSDTELGDDTAYLCILHPNDTQYVYAGVSVLDSIPKGYYDVMTENDIRDLLFDDAASEEMMSIERTSVNGIEYWVISGPIAGSPDVIEQAWMTHQNGKMYVLEFRDMANDSNTDSYVGDFEVLIESVKYE